MSCFLALSNCQCNYVEKIPTLRAFHVETSLVLNVHGWRDALSVFNGHAYANFVRPGCMAGCGDTGPRLRNP